MARRKKEKFFVSAKAALEKKAQDVVILDVKEMCSFADYFIICSGTSNRHVQGIATHIETRLKKEGFLPLGVEGLTEGAWILLDYDDVVVHIFLEPVRTFYDLERLWDGANTIEAESS
jgi:ribosome-associated protein